MPKSTYAFFFAFRIRYAETDAQGVVFYGNYLTFFDTAIYEYLRALPFDYGNHVHTEGADFHTVHVSVDYFTPVKFDDRIDVGVRTRKIGRSSLTFDVEAFLVETDTPVAKANLVWVNTDQTTHQATALPDDLVRRIRARESSLQHG